VKRVDEEPGLGEAASAVPARGANGASWAQTAEERPFVGVEVDAAPIVACG
jgi:hypothetical protein